MRAADQAKELNDGNHEAVRHENGWQLDAPVRCYNGV